MKKLLKHFITFVFIFCTLVIPFGCTRINPLEKHVSELRQDVFIGQSENFSVKAHYGFKETPFNNDGKARERIYYLTFRLLNLADSSVTYTLTMQYNGQTFNSTFKLDPVSHSLNCAIEMEDFNQKNFNVTLSNGSYSEVLSLSSTLPNGTITYLEALDKLRAEQTQLLKAYEDEDGNFNAEIYVRVIVKDSKPYWYVGIASGNNSLKALLIDGLSGEVLAIREIF